MKKALSIVVLLPLSLMSGVIDREVLFPREELTITGSGDCHQVGIRGCTPFPIPGAPELAVRYLTVVLPPSADVTGIEVHSYSRMRIPGTFQVSPVQYPPTFSRLAEEPVFLAPDTDIYSLTTEYPGELVRHLHTGTKGGFRIAVIALYPLQYIPVRQALFLYDAIRFRIHYQEGVAMPGIVWQGEQAALEKEVVKMVDNPEDVPKWHAGTQSCPRVGARTAAGLEFRDPEYMIMATDEFVDFFKPLKTWKTRKGVPTNIVNLKRVFTNPSATIDAERVKDFIIEYHENHGTRYFLLAGDFERFPVKYVNTIDDPYTPSDLWYADYDEDFFTNVYVGRVSANTQAEAETFVSKVLEYEKDPPLAIFQEKIFLPAYQLWADYGSPVNDSIAAHDPQSWQDAKRYDWLYPMTRQEISDSFNVGFAYANISAHGDWDIWGGNDSYHSIHDADSLSNVPPLTGVVTAISCRIGQLDYAWEDCYVEHMMNNPRGGTVAFLGNSRNGYGRIQNHGRSEWLCIWFYEELVTNGIRSIGHTVGAAKDRCAMFAPADPYAKHCMHTAILFGDPEMPLWVFRPGPLVVSHDSIIPVNTEILDVHVSDGSAPIENARVCIMCARDTLYSVAFTNAAGIAQCTLGLSIISDTCFITVTYPDFLPYEGCATVIGPGILEEYTASQQACWFAKPFPAPAKDVVHLKYALPRAMPVTVKLYNTVGQNIHTILEDYQQAGVYQVEWESSRWAEIPANGVYFIQFRGDDITITHKLIILAR